MATTMRTAGAATSRLLVAGRVTRAWSRAQPVRPRLAEPIEAGPGAFDGRVGAAPTALPRRRCGPFDSIVNLARMTLAVGAGMVLGAFICAALGY
jgi:hypothetical protein